MFVRHRRSNIRHRMLSSYTTSHVLTCISYVHAYNIAYDIAYDIVCDVHSIGFGAGFRGSNCMHDRAGTGVCMAMDSFRHRPPNQRRQGQAAPERHRRRSGGRGSIRGGFGASEDSASSARRRRGFGENVIAWTEGIRDQCAACACTHRRACMHIDARMRACRAGPGARFRRERTRLDRRNT